MIRILVSCANPGMPSGGPKDETPPQLTTSEPANYSKNFKDNRIRIYFDEYIKQKDLQKQLLISPPMEEKPEINFKGKYIDIKFLSELRDSTTYSINFGNSIIDNNEGNVLKDFQFVFATGNELDSMQIQGFLKDAKTNNPVEGVLVMLYKNTFDSVPYNEIPVYVSRTDKSGLFKLRNLSDTSYLIFALKDNNQNYLFDQPSEKIAFLDSLINPYVLTKELIDTIPLDTLGNDSIVRKTDFEYLPDSITLYLFEEDYYNPYLKTKARPLNNQLILALNEPITPEFRIQPIDFVLDSSNHIYDLNKERDSLNIWITDTALANRESLSLIIDYTTLDSVKQTYVKTDTVNLKYRAKKDEAVFLKLISEPSKILKDRDTLLITFIKPISVIDTSLIRIQTRVDTNMVFIPYNIESDDAFNKRFFLHADWEKGKKYQVIFDSLAFTAFDNQANDSIALALEVKEDGYYGSLVLNIEHSKEQLIIQLLNNKEQVLEEQIINSSSKINFTELEPGVFKVRAIIDGNRNGIWDTGNYLLKRYPEKVVNFGKDISIKSNWEMEEEWRIN